MPEPILRKAKFNHICASLLDHLVEKGTFRTPRNQGRLPTSSLCGNSVWHVFVSKKVQAHPLRRLLRPLVVTSFSTATAGVVVWSAAAMVAIGGTSISGSKQFLPTALLHTGKNATAGKGPRLIAAAPEPDVAASPVVVASLDAGDLGSAYNAIFSSAADANPGVQRFEIINTKAGLATVKLANAFEYAKPRKSQRAIARAAEPAPERFASLPPDATDQPETLLAFADPSPTAVDAWSAVLAPEDDGVDIVQDPNVGEGEAAQPSDEGLPSLVPLPQLRPIGRPAPKAVVQTQPEVQPEVQPEDKQPAVEPVKPQAPKLAYARPNEPSEKKSGGGLGSTLRNLFGGGAKAGNGVAVYDISAAKVYMPDGTVLEAHSGIGKMVDNPRYVDVKMGGPTPPHTYDLKMRETRFHGVEALRMLPVDGKNRNGRTGLLAHSYLLRGGRAESHGCVAFKDYARFLKAFKQGKVKRLVVVPSGGRSTVRVASNDKSI